MNEEIQVPGIDDCDALFQMSDRKGNDVVYLRCHRFDSGIYAQATIDCNTAHFCGDLGGTEGPFESFEAAFWGCIGVFDWFADNGIRGYFCDSSKKLLRRVADRDRRAKKKETK